MTRQLISDGPINHPIYETTRAKFIGLCRSVMPNKIIVLVGPTNVGKSLIFDQACEALYQDFAKHAESEIPIISLRVEPSRDGRVSPKYLTFQLLRQLRHPVYMDIGTLDQTNQYRPAIKQDETTLHLALRQAVAARSTHVIGLDEAHHLTRSKDPEVRKGALTSLKCLTDSHGTLILVGGYELILSGVFDCAHFSARCLFVEFPPYQARDINGWRAICKAFGKRLPLERERLVFDHASLLLKSCHGCVGLLEKVLVHAQALSIANKCPLDDSMLMQALPPEREHQVIAQDIARGREALSRVSGFVRPEDSVGIDAKRAASKAKPFKRKPNRAPFLEGTSNG